MDFFLSSGAAASREAGSLPDSYVGKMAIYSQQLFLKHQSKSDAKVSSYSWLLLNL